MALRARHRRFAWIALGLFALAVAAALVLNAFRSNLVFFYTPTQVFANEAPKGREFLSSIRSAVAALFRWKLYGWALTRLGST